MLVLSVRSILFSNIYGRPIVTAFAESTSLGTGSSVAHIDVLSDGVGLQRALGLHGGEQRIVDVLADDSSGATDDPRTHFDIGAGNDTAIVVNVFSAGACEVLQVDVVVVVVVGCGIKEAIFLLHALVELRSVRHVIHRPRSHSRNVRLQGVRPRKIHEAITTSVVI